MERNIRRFNRSIFYWEHPANWEWEKRSCIFYYYYFFLGNRGEVCMVRVLARALKLLGHMHRSLRAAWNEATKNEESIQQASVNAVSRNERVGSNEHIFSFTTPKYNPWRVMLCVLSVHESRQNSLGRKRLLYVSDAGTIETCDVNPQNLVISLLSSRSLRGLHEGLDRWNWIWAEETKSRKHYGTGNRQKFVFAINIFFNCLGDRNSGTVNL